MPNLTVVTVVFLPSLYFTKEIHHHYEKNNGGLNGGNGGKNGGMIIYSDGYHSFNGGNGGINGGKKTVENSGKPPLPQLPPLIFRIIFTVSKTKSKHETKINPVETIKKGSPSVDVQGKNPGNFLSHSCDVAHVQYMLVIFSKKRFGKSRYFQWFFRNVSEGQKGQLTGCFGGNTVKIGA